MEIKNTKSLNANTYDFISIGKCVSVNQVKNTWGNKKINDNLPFNPVGTRFTSTLKGLTEEEKMNEIIRYFLRSNTIYEIIYEVYNATGYTVIKALGDRSLRISESHTLSKEIMHEIYQKYYLDRGKIIQESKCDNIIFGCASWSSTEIITPRHYYMIPSAMHDKECLQITFELNKNEDISDADKKIFNQILSEIMEDVTYISDCYSNFYIIRKKDGRLVQMFLYDGCIQHMKDVMKEYVREFKNKDKEKSLQKKMEGF